MRIQLLLSLFLAGALALLAACQTQSASTVEAVRIDQWSGRLGGMETPAVRVLRSPEQWESAWQQVGWGRPRAIDAAEEMGVAVFLGDRPTGGYSVRIVSAQPESGRFVVAYRETKPEPGRIYTQALTNPWAIAMVPRTDLPVVARDQRTGQEMTAN